MVDVVRSNFSTIIPQVVKQIEDSTFVAIDAEYTGLFAANGELANSLFDTPAKRYQKLKNGFCNFQISQFGLAIFSKRWDKNEFCVESYNFYLYPVAFYKFRERTSFQCQISSFNFLSVNNFDFNKFIKEGAPYLRPDDVESLRQYLRNNRHFMTDIEHRDKDYFPRFSRQLEDCDIDEIIDHLTGFSKVIQAIKRAKKPVVGHNMLMDLMLIYQQFCGILPESYEEFKAKIHELFPIVFDTKTVVVDLRRDVLERRSKNITDSEFMFDTALLVLYKNLANIKNFFGPFINLKNESMKYCAEMETVPSQRLENASANSHYHEAAFDACVTGGVFVYLSHIAFRQSSRCPNTSVYSTTVVELFANLEFYKNRVNIVRSTSDFIDLEGIDPLPTRPPWLRVERSSALETRFNVKWLRTQLPRFGDVDIEQETSTSILLACAGWGCAKNVWTFLTGLGFKVTGIGFVSKPKFISAKVLTICAGVGVGAIMLPLYLYWK